MTRLNRHSLGVAPADLFAALQNLAEHDHESDAEEAVAEAPVGSDGKENVGFGDETPPGEAPTRYDAAQYEAARARPAPRDEAPRGQSDDRVQEETEQRLRMLEERLQQIRSVPPCRFPSPYSALL